VAGQVRHHSSQFVQAAGGLMLPGATVAAQRDNHYGDPFSVDFGLFHQSDAAAEALVAAERFSDQYWRVNVNPSDQYVSTPPDSTRHRPFANDTGFANLSLPGDWPNNGLNVGSMEGSVRSGLLAAEAILGISHADTGVIGFDPIISANPARKGG